MFGRSTATFDRMVDKATSQLLLDPDWDSTMQICDSIRQADVQPKYAVQAIRKKIDQDNPHVTLYALQVLESCMKNCGTSVHEEVATKEFMEFIKDLVQKRPDPVKARLLELIQIWSHAFRNEAAFKIVPDTYHLMKMEGHPFPTLREADAMFSSEKAPEWKDGECCHRCRVQFSTFQRKHHCRCCGQIFCAKCSAKASIIPKFGIEREVRVCDSCFEQLNKGGKKEEEGGLPQEYVNSPLSQQSQTPPTKSEQEILEEEELQLALALSKSEAEAKDSQRGKRGGGGGVRFSGSTATTADGGPADNSTPVYSQPQKVTMSMIDTSDMDPELARYLNRNYWEQKQDETKVPMATTTQPSAPAATAEAKMTVASREDQVPVPLLEEKYQNGETDDKEQFLNALRSSVEIFVNRMKSNSQRGRSIANDSSVQTLFLTINAMHPQLMNYISEQEDARTHYESLQDKLTQLKDAREALDALRDEQRERRRCEQEELERQRQIQMAHKLEILRVKKQEYLEYQRQLATQRMQEQAHEMQMRLEQQKQMQQMRAMQYGYPQMYGQQHPGFSPAGSAEGSPMHQAHGAPPGHYPVHPGAPGNQPLPPGTQQPPVTGAGPLPPPQPGYAQPGFQGQIPQGAMPPGAQSTQNPLPPQGAYQQPPPPGGYAPLPGGQAQFTGPPINTQPPAGHPGQQAAPGQPPSMDYQTYSMQSMSNALPNPNQLQQQGAAPGQPYMAPPPAQYAPPQGGQAPPPGMQAPPPGMQAPPPQLQQPLQQEGALISFD